MRSRLFCHFYHSFRGCNYKAIALECLASYRYIVILGDPGSGKSTLLQYIALNWARTPLNTVISQPIPLLIELRIYGRDRISGQCKDFLEFFHKGSVICRLNQPQLHEQLKAGKILVMFDGLDEVFDPAQREEVMTDIHRFTNDYPKFGKMSLGCLNFWAIAPSMTPLSVKKTGNTTLN